MRWSCILRVVGALIICIGLTMLFSLGFAVYYRDDSQLPLLESLGLAVALGASLFLPFRRERVLSINHREGMAIVTLSWVGSSLIGALPFYVGNVFETFTDAFFESVSGFTTTGSSVLIDIEVVAPGFLMWRSLTHWLGGMGIIVFSIAILPFLGAGGMQLYKAEVPGPAPDKLKPRIRDTAMVLWKVYLLFSLVLTALLMGGGMNLFDSLCHTFGTMATGGFSTKNGSVGHYNSAYLDIVITLFMLIAGLNFSLHYLALLGKPSALLKDPEARFFIGAVTIFTLACTVSVLGSSYDSFGAALRYSLFQVASIITTTGFVTADYEKWHPLPQLILAFCMFLGACAGSTGGGIKCMRVMLMLKDTYLELLRLIHPRAVLHVKMGRRIVPDEVMKGIWGFFMIYLGFFIVASFLLSAMGVDLVSACSAVAATLGNIGPGLGSVGPADNFAHLPALGKWLLSLCMLLGRLEIYTMVVLLVPEFWRK